ncbi:hypothetical protein ACF05L_38530 [Streptomyces bobili]|uniref:hypothetical protein n=1 Tax=Streptomyces bobili TaxID=67280 RepID=UPI0036FCD6DC
MDGKQAQQYEPSEQEARARRAMKTWRWVRWLALFLAISWAVGWVRALVKGEQGWPLVSTAIWAAVTVRGFMTHQIKTTTLPPTTHRS